MDAWTSPRLARLAGACALLAAALVLATVVHLAVVMPASGFTFAMLDDRALMLPWVADHPRSYAALWLLYLAAQVLLLPVTVALAVAMHRQGGDAGLLAAAAAVGLAALVLGAASSTWQLTTSSLVAAAYDGAAPSGLDPATLLLVGDLAADSGKEVRLVADLLLGLWLGGSAATVVSRRSARAVAAPLLAVGSWAVVVAVVKLADPRSPLEDTLGLVLAVGYAVVGAHLLRRAAPGELAVTTPAVVQLPAERLGDTAAVPRVHEREDGRR